MDLRLGLGREEGDLLLNVSELIVRVQQIALNRGLCLA